MTSRRGSRQRLPLPLYGADRRHVRHDRGEEGPRTTSGWSSSSAANTSRGVCRQPFAARRRTRRAMAGHTRGWPDGAAQSGPNRLKPGGVVQVDPDELHDDSTTRSAPVPIAGAGEGRPDRRAWGDLATRATPRAGRRRPAVWRRHLLCDAPRRSSRRLVPAALQRGRRPRQESGRIGRSFVHGGSLLDLFADRPLRQARFVSECGDCEPVGSGVTLTAPTREELVLGDTEGFPSNAGEVLARVRRNR